MQLPPSSSLLPLLPPMLFASRPPSLASPALAALADRVLASTWLGHVASYLHEAGGDWLSVRVPHFQQLAGNTVLLLQRILPLHHLRSSSGGRASAVDQEEGRKVWKT